MVIFREGRSTFLGTDKPSASNKWSLLTTIYGDSWHARLYKLSNRVDMLRCLSLLMIFRKSKKQKN